MANTRNDNTNSDAAMLPASEPNLLDDSQTVFANSYDSGDLRKLLASETHGQANVEYPANDDGTQLTINDFLRSDIYLNNQQFVLTEQTGAQIPALETCFASLHNTITDYIKQKAHQYGFFQRFGANTFRAIVLKAEEANKEIGLEFGRTRYDFIFNSDGSVTFIERFNINAIKSASFEPNAPVIKSTEEGRPLAIGIETSLIRLLNGQIQHDYLTKQIFLLEQIELFNDLENTKTRYNKGTKGVKDEINNQIQAEVNYQQSLIALSSDIKTLRAQGDTLLADQKQIVLNEVQAEKAKCKPNELEKIRLLTDALEVAVNPNEDLEKLGRTVFNLRTKPYGKRIAAGIIAVFALGIIASSIAFAVLTLGAGAPLSIAGIALGVAALASITGAGCAAGIGFGISSGITLFKSAKEDVANRKIADTMKEIYKP